GSAAVRRRRRGFQAAFELLFDRLDLVLLRAELQGAPPLVAGLGEPAALPEGITQMVVDRRVLRHQLDRLFEVLHRAVIVAHAVMRPAQAVDDVAVLRPQLDRMGDYDGAVQYLEKAIELV